MKWPHGNLATWGPTKRETAEIVRSAGKEGGPGLHVRREYSVHTDCSRGWKRLQRRALWVSVHRRAGLGRASRTHAGPNSISSVRPRGCPLPCPLLHLTQDPQGNRMEIVCQGTNGATPSPTDLAEGLVGRAQPRHQAVRSSRWTWAGHARPGLPCIRPGLLKSLCASPSTFPQMELEASFTIPSPFSEDFRST